MITHEVRISKHPSVGWQVTGPFGTIFSDTQLAAVQLGRHLATAMEASRLIVEDKKGRVIKTTSYGPTRNGRDAKTYNQPSKERNDSSPLKPG